MVREEFNEIHPCGPRGDPGPFGFFSDDGIIRSLGDLGLHVDGPGPKAELGVDKFPVPGRGEGREGGPAPFAQKSVTCGLPFITESNQVRQGIIGEGKIALIELILRLAIIVEQGQLSRPDKGTALEPSKIEA